MSNLQVTEEVCKWYGYDNYLDYVKFTENRLGQDVRYSIDSSKLCNLGWFPEKKRGIYKWI